MKLIHAHSPQAKGRVERLFHTFQDWIIKELRLAGISTLDDANRFLEAYLPQHNQRFAVLPAQTADLHRPCPAAQKLDRILCCKTTRVLRRDWTVAHNGHLYQIQTNVRATHVQWKNDWMGPCASRTAVGRSPIRSSPLVRCECRPQPRSTSLSARSRRHRIIPGANGGGPNENNM